MQNKSKNTILLVIIIILLVAGLGYLYLNNSKEKNIENNNIENILSESKNTSEDILNSNENTEISLINETRYATIESVYKKDNKYFMELSYFKVLFGEEAYTAQIKEGWCVKKEECIVDYYLKFDLPSEYKKGTLEVSQNVDIKDDPREIIRVNYNYESIDEFIKFLASREINYYILTVKNSKIIELQPWAGN